METFTLIGIHIRGVWARIRRLYGTVGMQVNWNRIGIKKDSMLKKYF